MFARRLGIALLTLLAAAIPFTARALAAPVYGPVTFTRTAGPPQTVTMTFPFCGNVPTRLVITNGDSTGDHRVTAGMVVLNGSPVFGPSDFKMAVGSLSKTVTLLTQNLLSVRLEGKPGSMITVEVQAPVSPATLTPIAPSASLLGPGMLAVAFQLQNGGTETASGVQITSLSTPLGTLTAPPLPLAVGNIAPGSSAIVDASFNGAFVGGGIYPIAFSGAYAVGDSIFCFAETLLVSPPPSAPGQAPLNTVTIPPLHVTGAPYPPQPPSFDDDTNGQRYTVPLGPFVPGTTTPGGTQIMGIPPTARREGIETPGPIVFTKNANVGINGSTVGEPSGASGGGVVFMTSNWYAAYSTDGGTTWTRLNPTAIFPNDAVGFCCDQIVQYAPQIDRFIWLLQGSGMRIAEASPADIISSHGTSWTYWNITPDVFGQPVGTGVDYPDLSLGNTQLYMSWDNGWPGCPTGCRGGLQVARTSLAGLQAGGSISLGYTDPANSSVAWGSHLMQDTGDEIFWAGHVSTSSIRVFSCAENSNQYFWRDLTVSSWPRSTISSLTPDNQDWMNKLSGFPGNAPIGATRVGNQLWFAWSAGTNNTFSKPHVQMVAFDRTNNFNKLQQVQIWNPDYAFGYPALATNACSQEVGLSLEFGGGGNYENHVVGLWGDFVVYLTTASNQGTTRYGDYVTIRQQPQTTDNPGNLFDAFGYELKSATGGGTTANVHYVSFGRPSSACQVIGAPSLAKNGAPGVKPGTAPEAATPDAAALPAVLALGGVFPNPVTRHSTVVFELPQRGHVRAVVFDLQGRQVATVLDEVMDAGPHVVSWDRGGAGALRLAPGTYLLSLSTEQAAVRRKITVLE